MKGNSLENTRTLEKSFLNLPGFEIDSPGWRGNEAKTNPNTEKLGSVGPCCRMDPWSMVLLFHTSESRRQVCCVQLSKEEGLASFGFQGAVSDCNHPGGGRCRWYFLHSVEIYTKTRGRLLHFYVIWGPWCGCAPDITFTQEFNHTHPKRNNTGFCILLLAYLMFIWLKKYPQNKYTLMATHSTKH